MADLIFARVVGALGLIPSTFFPGGLAQFQRWLQLAPAFVSGQGHCPPVPLDVSADLGAVGAVP